MPRRWKARPILPPRPTAITSSYERLRRVFRKSPVEARAKGADRPAVLGLVLAWAAGQDLLGGRPESAEHHARDAAELEGGDPDASAAALLLAAEAWFEADEPRRAEILLVESHYRAYSALNRGVALARLALLYHERNVPLGFRFYAPRALRILDREACCGIHPGADVSAARLACAVLEYHHRRDEPERSGRAHSVLQRARDAEPATTVKGLKYHGLALGRLQEWLAAEKTFADAAHIAEDHDLRGCDGVFVYAAVLTAVHEQDFVRANRWFKKAHIRRLTVEEKAFYRQFRELAKMAKKHRPLSGDEKEKFLRNKRRRERAAERKAEVLVAEGQSPKKPAKKKAAKKKAAKKKKATPKKKATTKKKTAPKKKR
ncbi:MAG: hypothetical protein ACYTG4_00850 [Planctomycetota bacterium]|jgi:adenylate kinase